MSENGNFSAGKKERAALVIGGGIAGIQAALDIADAGFKVHLVERSPSIGGRMSQLDKTFPTLDCSSCILTPKMADVPRNPNINLMTCAEVAAVDGTAGEFHVTVERSPRYVDVDSCTGCGLCAEACPVVVPSQFNAGLSRHKAIYQVFPQAIPNAYTIEKNPSPCKNSCPAHIPVQGYVALIAEGKYQQALERVRQSGVPFVGTLGRVCYHPCEEICKRGDWDESVAICALKRFAYDSADEQNQPQLQPVKYQEKVAIVGAGPAGLTAGYELCRLGYQATIFDSLPVAGGMLAVGIPAYRLPRQVLNQEVDYIRGMGVDIRLNTPIGRDGGPGLDELRQEYSAIFLAVGAHVSSRLSVPGEDLPGVLHGVTFLRKLNLGQEVALGRRVAVIGGGNTAVDAARCALRLGSQVTILYRRSRKEMPAAPHEVNAAEAEGVALEFLTAPVRIIEKNGQVGGVECVRMQLGEPDASGRRRPVPVPGSEFIIEVDTLIAAIGQAVDANGLAIEINRGLVTANPDTQATSIPGVFAGGDAVLGPASVVEAVGAGLRAAESIHRYLRGQDLVKGRPADRMQVMLPKAEQIQIKTFSPVLRGERAHMPELAVEERIHNFDEVELGYSEEQARAEARRCLSCAVCSECLECIQACQRGAIHHDDHPRQTELDVDAIVVATGFDVFDPHLKPELGYGQYPQVITTLEFERLASASGPTAGRITLNGHLPQKVVFIQCVGSRDQSLGLPNCSRVCCMAVAKQAHLAHERLPGAEVTVFYMDVRAFGKGFEEFYDRVRSEGILYRRGMPSEIIQRGDRLVVRAEDTLLGEPVEVEADLVVLATGLRPRQDAESLAGLLNLKQDEDGFFQEAHPKMQIVESGVPGVFLAGCCQGPKDIPDTVAHAKAAASAAMILLAGKGAGHASN